MLLQLPTIKCSTFKELLVSLIEKGTGVKIQDYHGHKIGQFGVDVIFNTTDTHLLTGSQDGKLFIYDVLKKEPVKVIQGHSQVLSGIDLH